MISPIQISKETQRRFILAKQGLYPGRRWRGKAGVLRALRTDCVLQIDPINVAARSHDLTLFGRVLNYQPSQLEEVLYVDRAGFDYGGTVLVYPMEELPYWRVVMARKVDEPRWLKFIDESGSTIDAVYQAVRQRGPLSTRDFEGEFSRVRGFRAGKDSSVALYYLWLKGDLMTHSRRNFDRLYDLRERIAPSSLDYQASTDEADAYLALKTIRRQGILPERNWRGLYSSMIQRKVSPQEAKDRLHLLQEAGEIAPVFVDGEPKEKGFVLAEDLSRLETINAGRIPDEWQPLESATDEEAVFLSPLEICTARGRSLSLFGFEYIWEVYKPEEKRRWGYYTLPILYGSQLIGRLDPKLDRDSGVLQVKGFWLEQGVLLNQALAKALAAGIKRLMRFLGAKSLGPDDHLPEQVAKLSKIT